METPGRLAGQAVGTTRLGLSSRRSSTLQIANHVTNIMKTKSNALRLLFASVALSAFASFAYAGPGPQNWETQRKEAQFKQLKAGDKIAFVCNECKTVSEMAIESPAAAMALCKEGATVTCPACKKTSKVVRKEKRNDPPTHSEVIYVNDKGEECAFVAKVLDKK